MSDYNDEQLRYLLEFDRASTIEPRAVWLKLFSRRWFNYMLLSAGLFALTIAPLIAFLLWGELVTCFVKGNPWYAVVCGALIAVRYPGFAGWETAEFEKCSPSAETASGDRTGTLQEGQRFCKEFMGCLIRDIRGSCSRRARAPLSASGQPIRRSETVIGPRCAVIARRSVSTNIPLGAAAES